MSDLLSSISRELGDTALVMWDAAIVDIPEIPDGWILKLSQGNANQYGDERYLPTVKLLTTEKHDVWIGHVAYWLPWCERWTVRGRAIDGQSGWRPPIVGFEGFESIHVWQTRIQWPSDYDELRRKGGY